ncbi:MAG TPA: hypothetical protein DEF82_06000, partial [Crocinitomicaceae bacterium]|nr:hypothetical protein [Crocinitomicaceae bacterium]
MLNRIRQEFPNKQDFYTGYNEPALYEKFQASQDGLLPIAKGGKWLFEELVSGHMENLYMFTNMKDVLIPESDKPLRYYFESARNDMFAKKHLQQELAGIRVVDKNIFDADGTPQVQLEVYDDGRWHKHEGMDEFARKLIRDAIALDNNNIHKLSPEKMAVEAKKHGKEYMFNPVSGGGVTMKGEKERNEISEQMSQKTLETIKKLPDNLKVEITLDEHGNETVDLTKLNDAAFDAIVQEGGMDATTAMNAKAIRDTIRAYYDSGFAAPNVMVCDYWGATKEIVKGGFLGRLKGKEVPITHRMFVPYELKISNKVADANGKPLSKPKITMTVTAVDYMAIHNNKIKTWSRPDVRRLFTSIDEMNVAFDKYIINMMQDPSSRVTSEELFRAKYGSNAAKVRDIMYNIFGAVKRGDEGFINSPGEEARTNVRGPNFPYHSLRLDRMVNLELTSSKPFAYHHGNSYEGLRRNLSTEGFERITNTRYRDRQGYEIFVKGGNFKVYSPFGQEIDVVDSFKRAAKLAGKHFKKLDDSDKLPSPDGFNSEAFIGGSENVKEQTKVRDRLNAYLSNFDSKGRMLSSDSLAKDGTVIHHNHELIDVVELTKFAKFYNKNFDLVQAAHNGFTPTNLIRIKNILTQNSLEKLYANVEIGNVQLNYPIGEIPVIFTSTTMQGGDKMRFITGENKNNQPFTEAEYVKEMRREGRLCKFHVTKNGPALVFDLNPISGILKLLTKEEKQFVVQAHFTAELDSIYNGSRTDSIRGPVSRDALSSTLGTFGKTLFNSNALINLKNVDISNLANHPNPPNKLVTQQTNAKLKKLMYDGDVNDKLFGNLLKERSNLLKKYGEYKIHKDSEGNPATILLLPQEKLTELVAKNHALWKHSQIVKDSKISHEILKLYSEKIDHFQTQTLQDIGGVSEFGNVTIAFANKDDATGKVKTLLMVNPELFSEGAHNAWFVQYSDKGVIVHGSSGISIIADSTGGKNRNGGYSGDFRVVVDKIRGIDGYENLVSQSATTRDYFNLNQSEQYKYFERTISDAIRGINPT